MFDAMEINALKKAEINSIVVKITVGKARYENIERQTGVPWFFIGVIHLLEANCNFTKHLHNGDPLSARTVQVPKGRPLGTAPFTWEESALDALQFKSYDKVKNWTVPNMLLLFEEYNGMGYRKYHPDVNSPYLWSYSNLYTVGKYDSDGKFNPNLVSKQAGAAVILKSVMIRHNLLTAAVVAGGSIVTVLLLFAAFFF